MRSHEDSLKKVRTEKNSSKEEKRINFIERILTEMNDKEKRLVVLYTQTVVSSHRIGIQII